jgi:molecular chaperone DnaK (HSP70)
MERVEAKNSLEAYLYNTRNALQEEKVKTTLKGDAKKIEEWVQEGIQWLEENGEEEKEAFQTKQKEVEEKIRPIMAKLYQEAGAPGAEDVD